MLTSCLYALIRMLPVHMCKLRERGWGGWVGGLVGVGGRVGGREERGEGMNEEE